MGDVIHVFIIIIENSEITVILKHKLHGNKHCIIDRKNGQIVEIDFRLSAI